MKKIAALIMAMLILLTMFTAFASDSVTLYPKDAAYHNGVEQGNVAKMFGKGKYIGFKDVDLTGMNSVHARGKLILTGNSNGETLRVMIDNPISGEQIGAIVLSEEKTEFSAYIEPASGIHDVYFVGCYYTGVPDNVIIESFTFKKEVYNDTALYNQVSDDFIKDFEFDTWSATDSLGRRVATYAETGPVKSGMREVGIMYWNWFGQGNGEHKIISEILKEYPDAMSSFSHEAWKGMPSYYWDEPALGFYGSHDYFIYRRHAELLAAAGVDAVFMDWSNSGHIYVKGLLTLADAFRDAKRDGIKVPEISAYINSDGDSAKNLRLLESIYYACFYNEDFSDIWYRFDGKPLLFGYTSANQAMKAYNKDDKSGLELGTYINDFFTFKAHSKVRGADEAWMWIENFPQKQRGGIEADGRYEFVAVGVAINESYVLGKGVPYVLSDKYAKGRGYSNVFGEDYTEDGPRLAYYFREQANLALKADPHFIYVDGWNEFTAGRQNQYQGFEIAFVDTFDNENSRDMEPVKGALGDDYYMLLCDFVRKYKGTRPPKAVTVDKTIDITGDDNLWEDVENVYYNPKADNDNKSNRVTLSKAAKDSEYLYFMGKTEGEIFGNALYLNIDRNAATGFSGYDFAIGRNGGNAVESMKKDGTYEAIGQAEKVISGKTVKLKIPRNILGEVGIINMEFKWIDGEWTDIKQLYGTANTSPLGRFNYVFTEYDEKAISFADREALKGSTVIAAGKNKMVVSGAVQYVYEADISKTPFVMNNTLYIPKESFEEILGYGESKISYDSYSNIFYFRTFDLDPDLTEVINSTWCYTEIGSNEVRVNGYLKTLSAPVVTNDGNIYVPISIISDCYGINIKALSNGIYIIGDATDSAVNSALAMM